MSDTEKLIADAREFASHNWRRQQDRDLYSALADALIAALATTGGETEWMVRSKYPPYARVWDSAATDEETARAVMSWTGDGIERELFQRSKAGAWVAVDPTSPETTEERL